VALILVFITGVGILAFLLQPSTVRETYSPETYWYVSGCLASDGAFITLMLWITSRFSAWQERRIMRNLTQKGGHWAVWQYTAEEWLPLAEMQTAYERGVYKWWYTLISVLMVAGLFGYITFASEIPAEARNAYWPIGIFMVGMVVLMGIGYQVRQRVVSQQNHERRIKVLTPTLYIGRKGLYHETEGVLRFNKLQDISLKTGENPSLVFAAWMPGGRGRSYLRLLPIPVPHQHMADAQRIVNEFHAAKAH
jgi:hypothetical protein